MKLRPLLAVVLAALFLAQCGTGDLARRIPADKVTVATGDASEAAALISRYRASKGLSAVKVDATLNRAAAQQARAVAEAGKLDHGAFPTRMAAFGIGGVSAENLSAGRSSVAEAVARWKGSAGHNANLLMPEARSIGIARADTPGHGYERYWALVLAQ